MRRVKARNWCLVLDNQLRSCSGRSGLRYFVRDELSELWSSPFSWPWLGISMDLGSDGNSCVHALGRLFSINCDMFNDQSHGASCDWDLMLKAVGAKSMWILMVVWCNMPHGPREGEDLRLHQMKECLEHMYSGSRPSENPLFGAFCARIKACLDALGVVLAGSNSQEEEIWEWLRSRAAFGKGGRRVSMCRFLSTLAACKDHSGYWAVDEFERTYCCLEMDFLGSRKLGAMVLKRDAAEAAEGGERACSTGGNRPCVEEAVVRSCSQNAVVISMLMLSDHTNMRFCRILATVESPLLEWHGEQNRETRQASSSHQWYKQQVLGGYQAHLAGNLRLLETPAALQNARFVLTPDAIKQLGSDLASEEEFADFFGQSVLALTTYRAKQNLNMVSGWPKQLLRILGSEQEAAQVVRLFKSDYEARCHMKEAHCTPAMKLFLKRSAFNKTSVMKMVECFKLAGWQVTAAIRKDVVGHSCGLMQTQIIEDIIGHQKNNKNTQAKLRCRRPVASMCAALAGDVISERHKFRTVSGDYALESKADRLKGSHFRPEAKDASLKFSEIVSTTADAPYWSPKAERNGLSAADLEVVREYMRCRGPVAMDKAELSCVCSCQRRLALRSTEDADPDAFLLAMRSYPRSAAMVWPCRRHAVSDASNDSYMDFDFSAAEPMMVSIYDLSKWEACKVEWHSWAWQKITLGRFAGTLTLAIRPVLKGDPKPLIEVCAGEAFWALSKANVEMLASAAGVEVDTSGTLCRVLEQVVGQVCRLFRAFVMHMCQPRTAIAGGRRADASIASCVLVVGLVDSLHVCVWAWQGQRTQHAVGWRAIGLEPTTHIGSQPHGFDDGPPRPMIGALRQVGQCMCGLLVRTYRLVRCLSWCMWNPKAALRHGLRHCLASRPDA